MEEDPGFWGQCQPWANDPGPCEEGNKLKLTRPGQREEGLDPASKQSGTDFFDSPWETIPSLRSRHWGGVGVGKGGGSGMRGGN